VTAALVAVGVTGALGMLLTFVLGLRLSDHAERAELSADARRVAELGQRTAEQARDAALTEVKTLRDAVAREQAARVAADAAAKAAREEANRAVAANAAHLSGDDLARAVDDQLRGEASAVPPAAAASGAG